MTASALRPPTVVLARSATRAASGRDPAELVGETLLDRYRVVRLIGEGGMALVYAGTHTAIDRPVAIKVLRRRYADESDTVERFLREARASSVVRHEHVVEVTDFGTTDDGLVFMVMEYLEGETLADILQREGRMPWARVHGIALQICEALHAAHRAGVVHRDVTLRNCVRIRRKANHDYIKLLDFGIAKLMEPRIHGVVRSDPRRLTSDMDVFGTPEFMSPEQAKRSVDADPRSDIYATGVLLYALLTGRLPFEAGSAAEVMSRHIYDDVPPPSLHEPALPLAVEAVVLRALQKDPNQRFQSMSEFCAAIQAIPISATNAGGTSAAAASWSSPSVGGTTGLLQRRRVATRPPFLLGGLTALAVIALVGVTGWFSPERDPATPPPVVIRATSMPSPLPSPSVAMPFLPSKAPKLTIRASQRRDAAP
ncbi:MAG TPA: serine/threonine-protein kinase, partial [Nannocystaceae bacterium]|nr:serine/threonine-protein kinase [Nannocystaceae bacterium]